MRRCRAVAPRALRVAGALLLLGSAGCSWMPFVGGSDVGDRFGPAIADLVEELPAVELPETARVRPSREEVMAAYDRVYGLIPDPGQNHAVGKRLADLQMSLGEERDIAGEEDPYGGAVALYESLLDSVTGEGKDEILYQLARAHDVVGDTDAAVRYLDRLVSDHPDSRFVPEARFRRAEIAFSREDYRAAASDYGYVVKLGDETPYLQTAQYMRGWSLFKTSDLDWSLESFYAVLDGLLGDSDQLVMDARVEGLDPSERELLEDTFRVTNLALNYLDGAKTLAAEMERLDRPSWQYLAYQRLADDHLARERYLDSVATWQTFIDRNPLDPRSPQAHIGMIRTLTQADFPSEIRPKKEAFVAGYGVYSQFWSVHGEDVVAAYEPTLKAYLEELAKLDHAAAQALPEADGARARRERIAAFLKAADWYEEYIVTFPDDPDTAKTLFLLGEVYTEADEHGQAVAAFQRVIRDFPDYERAGEAGYAAILGLDELVASAPAEERELWQRVKIDAQIEFALLFPGDQRAPAAQGDAADSLFDLGEYEQAVGLAENLLVIWPDIEVALQRPALAIIGHGHFELGNLLAAENAYRTLLTLPLEADEADKVQERLLAAVYKQGEAAEAAGELDLAVDHLLRLRSLDPTAEIAIQGHYDAVAVLEGAGRIDEAAALLDEFRSLYPEHPLGRDTAKRLAAMYEDSGNSRRAAGEYLRLADSAEEADVRRQSRYRAAELYLELGETAVALENFRSYANTYDRPFDLRLEAIHHLDEIYAQLGDDRQRRRWLAEKIELHDAMGRQATARATYLAAQASYLLAEDDRVLFEAIRLTHPLPESLKRKQSALKQAVRAYEQVADYEVADYATAATYQIASLYASLSQAILASDRPAELSELELAQYEILLEEQAFPFEEQAIELHEINMRRSWQGVYDDWVKKSFSELSRLMPARFDKQEVEIAYVDAIH